MQVVWKEKASPERDTLRQDIHYVHPDIHLSAMGRMLNSWDVEIWIRRTLFGPMAFREREYMRYLLPKRTTEPKMKTGLKPSKFIIYTKRGVEYWPILD